MQRDHLHSLSHTNRGPAEGQAEFTIFIIRIFCGSKSVQRCHFQFNMQVCAINQ